MGPERAHGRDLGDGVVRGAQQVLGVLKLALAEEVPEGHAEAGDLPGQVLARHLEGSRVVVGPHGRSRGKAVVQIERPGPLEELEKDVERELGSASGTHTRGVRELQKSPPAMMQDFGHQTGTWVTGRPAPSLAIRDIDPSLVFFWYGDATRDADPAQEPRDERVPHMPSFTRSEWEGEAILTVVLEERRRSPAARPRDAGTCGCSR